VLRRISGLKRKYQEAGENCIMRNCIMRNCMMRNYIMRNCIMRNCIMRNCMLRNCIMRNCIMRNCIMRNCIMRNCIMRNSVIRNATKCFSFDEVDDSELRRTCSMRCTNGKAHSSSSENLKESFHFGDQLQIGS
jgi:hypothetical protein